LNAKKEADAAAADVTLALAGDQKKAAVMHPPPAATS
jgi:hypothetical protein